MDAVGAGGGGITSSRHHRKGSLSPRHSYPVLCTLLIIHRVSVDGTTTSKLLINPPGVAPWPRTSPRSWKRECHSPPPGDNAPRHLLQKYVVDEATHRRREGVNNQ